MKGTTAICLHLDKKIYPLQVIFAAGYVFLDRAYLYLDSDKKDKVCVYLYPKDKLSKNSVEKLKGEFCNELVNYAHYFSTLKNNGEVMKILLQRALFSASPQLAQEAEEKGIEDLIKEIEEEK